MSRTFLVKDTMFQVTGEELKVGQPAPNFTVIEKTPTGLQPFKLSDFVGKVVLVNVVPSLDTGICSTQTKTVNAEIEQLPANVQVVTISMDLPYAQARFAESEGITKVRFGSDHRDANFASAFGTLVTDLRLQQRSMFVVDKGGVVRYTEYVPVLTQEPNYTAAFEVARKLAAE